jgi:hypothetical protein
MKSLLAALICCSALLGCDSPCRKGGECSVVGMGREARVCDGDNYRECGDKNRGQVIGCVARPQEAVCTIDGWAFQPTSP